MLSILWNLAAFIVALGVLITVHEFGHFWVARKAGVRVERFSIGFGKALWRRTDRQGTEYVIALIPLGGYVKMLDERVEPVTPEMRHEAFNNKTVAQRAAIIAAGPIANFLFAVFAYWLVFLIGIPSIKPVIGEITPNSIAAQAQIEPGTELKAIDGIETPDWDAVRLALVAKIGDERTTLSVAPFGSDARTDKTLDLRNWQFEPDKEDPVSSLGIQPRGPKIEPVLAEVQPQSAASKAGLQAGDRIVKVEGQPLTTWMTFVTLVRDNPSRPLSIEIERQGSPLSLTLIPDTKPGNEKAEGFAGVVPKVIPLPEEYKTVRQYGPFAAIAEATDKTWQLMKLTVTMLGKLITGDVKLNNLSGPISIAQGAGMSAEYGLVYYLMFLALISVNLGIINLFPLPVLDGGHLLFLAIEKLKGGPVSERVQDFSYRIGSILLVLLMGLALFNDFSRL
ncbi:sigma E protease regulator RseP [Franconibacter sp. IITDAS19]|uniref:Zinc metalloprotease n=1 Tax=Franconibacter pulveris TaxID=435910 RepID=A0A0J8VR83_9ENTR|nr:MULTISPECIES: sigma E protease regulator RseP [Franconibacter]KMV35040.1 zinc metallopeptidase RseP [Franconibacter pulveris]MCK1969554.1 sigma E protease regulator RseP [Franconibacter sp. IITDAS19]GGD28575.1 regulator of sigma E protease [Franconibacter daqui]